MLSEGTVGQQNVADGVPSEMRLTRTKSIAVAVAHDDFYDAISRGNCFHAAQQAAAALGTALTATAVTLTLYNPLGSNRNVSLIGVSLAIPAATVAGVVVYAVNDTAGQAAPTATTAATIRNALLGAGNKNQAVVYTAATLPGTPQVAKALAGVLSTTPSGIHTILDRPGFVLAPGSMVTIQGLTTNATALISMLWEEINL